MYPEKIDPLEILRYSVESIRQQYNNAQSQANAIEGKIRRLESAQDELTLEMDRFKKLKQDVRPLFKSNNAWKGQTVKAFGRKGSNLIDASNSFYTSQLKRLRKEIDAEIELLRKKQKKLCGTMGSLTSRIAYLTSQISDILRDRG